MRCFIAAVAGLLLATAPATAQNKIALDEIVGSWLGDDEVQYVKLRLLDMGQNAIAGVGVIVFDDPSGETNSRRFFQFPANVARDGANVKVLVATASARDQANLAPDFILPPGLLHPTAGRVCYGLAGVGTVNLIDCVAYGKFTGDNGTFGAPTRLPPDNLVLRRKAYTGKNRADWTGALDPMLENNAGALATLHATQCGDALLSQGEECDGDALGGATCTSLGFAKGKLACTLCHYDTSGCTTCGDGEIQGKEQCDGDDLGERTCATLGFTGGTLACTDDCKLTTQACDGTFFVPGGGPPKTDCLGEWRLASRTDGPTVTGKLPPRQRCKDGDATCDADGAANGTCVFAVAQCFSRKDARVASCPLSSVSGWSLLGTVDPANPTTSALVASVAALGTSTVDGVAVTFAPILNVEDACGEPVDVPVPVRKRVVLRARTLGPTAGKPRDSDILRLVCTP